MRRTETARSQAATFPRGGRLVAILGLAGCALFQSPPEETPPEAPTARQFRTLAPSLRDNVFPPPTQYEAVDFINRLVCPSGDTPNAKRTSRKGVVDTYEVQCPGAMSDTIVLDRAMPAPAPPSHYRLLSDRSYLQYRDAMIAGDKKDYARMLAELNSALKITPGEPVYRLERVYALYSLGRPLEALLEADDLLKVFPTAPVHRYRALAAMQLGMRDAVMTSLDGIVKLTHPGDPMYAEAICTKGLLLARDGDASADALLKEACALDYQACCDALKDKPTNASFAPADAGAEQANQDAGAAAPDAGPQRTKEEQADAGPVAVDAG
jgi:tetratricopeptide (TPR) repeat protein